jgi:hypothetical protein
MLGLKRGSVLVSIAIKINVDSEQTTGSILSIKFRSRFVELKFHYSFSMAPCPSLSEYPTLIASELENVLPKATLAELEISSAAIKVPPEKQMATEALVLKMANAIAIEHRLTVSYSNFHTWEHLRKFKTKKEARDAELPQSFKSFQNCLLMANACAEALRAALLAKHRPTTARYVEVATDNWNQRPNSAREYHCLVMVRLPECCIIIDPVFHHYAFRVPLGEVFTVPWPDTYTLCYVAFGDTRLLVHCEESHNALEHPLTKRLGITYGDPFRSVVGGFKGGIANLAYPTDAYIGQVPSKRSIAVEAVWDHKPTTEIDYSALDDGSGRVLLEVCRISIDFREHELCIGWIPVEWLAWKENTSLKRRLQRRNGSYVTAEYHPLFEWFQDSLATYKDVQQGFTQRTMKTLKFMEELCVALGMPKGELLRIANVMLEVWQEEDRKEPKKDLKRKRS